MVSSLKSKVKDSTFTFSYNGKKVEIDISKELSITENNLTSQLSSQPSSYAYLSLVKAEAIKIRDKLEKEKDLAFSKSYVAIKESNSRVTNELATHKANISAKYQLAYDKYLEAKEFSDKVTSLCRAFEQKAQLLQTVSSNLRRES